MNRRILIAAASLLVLAAIVGSVAWRPLLIWYHTSALDRIHEKIYSAPTTVTSTGLAGFGSAELFERQERHCNRLVALGYFFHKRYEMENLPDNDDVHGALWRLVQQEFPDRRYPTLSYPDNVLEVWDLADHETQWDAFAEKHNVADFPDRFLAGTADGSKESQKPVAGKPPN